MTGTLLNPPTNYTSIFLRKTFEITNYWRVAKMKFNANYDDGIVVWLNSFEILRLNVDGFLNDPVTYNMTATSEHEASGFEPNDVSQVLYLLPGSNIIAVQVFNVSSNSDDLVFDASLEAELSPGIVGIHPPPGPVADLTTVTVQFSEPVFGVTATNFLINDVPATSVSGGGDTYTFSFSRPLPNGGIVYIRWADFPYITNSVGYPFIGAAPDAIWDYTLQDTLAPTLTDLRPAPGSLVFLLNQVRVAFSEAVKGVDAADLLMNGQPALNVITQSPSAYLFQFARARPGNVQVAWADGHGITDLAPEANPFAGGNWSYIANRAAYSILLNPNTNTALITFSNRFSDGVCTVEGRDEVRGARWVPLVNFYTTQRLGQATVTLPTNYPILRLVCMDISPGNAFTRLALAYGKIHTIAGRGEVAPGTNAWRPEYEGAMATEVNLSNPRYAVADSAGNIYVVERDGHAVDKITPDGRIHTFVGRHMAGFDAAQDVNGTNGTDVLLNTPSSLYLAGHFLFILDGGNHRIRATDISSPIARTTTLYVDLQGMGTNASGLWVGLNVNGLGNEALYGVGNQLRRWPFDPADESPLVTANFFEIRNIIMNPQDRPYVADPVEGRVYRVRGGGLKEVIAGRGFSNRRSLGGDVERVPLPGASSVWYLPAIAISKDAGLGYFISLDEGATVWYVDRRDNAVPFIFGAPGAHAGDGEWHRRGGRTPKVSNVLSVTLSPAGHMILVEGNGIVRQIDFLRHRP